MSSSIFMSKLHYMYIQITIYVYPNSKICIQVVIFMSKMSIDTYRNAVSMVRFIYNFRRFFTYLQTVLILIRSYLAAVDFCKTKGHLDSFDCFYTNDISSTLGFEF